MKKSFMDRVQALEAQAEKQQPTPETITFYDEGSGLKMQLIGEGLVVPAPMTIEEWESYMERQINGNA